MSEQTKAWLEGAGWAAVVGGAMALQSSPINWRAVAVAALLGLAAYLRNNVKALPPPAPPTDPTKQA